MNKIIAAYWVCFAIFWGLWLLATIGTYHREYKGKRNNG